MMLIDLSCLRNSNEQNSFHFSSTSIFLMINILREEEVEEKKSVVDLFPVKYSLNQYMRQNFFYSSFT